MKRLIVLICLLYSPLIFWAQNLQILNKSNNLLSDNINEIEIDDNYLWAATNEGVYRINKSLKNPESKVFKRTSVAVLSILNLKDKILIGLKDKGLYYIDKNTLELTAAYRNLIGKGSVYNLFNLNQTIIAKVENQYYILDENSGNTQEISSIDFQKKNQNTENFYWKNDTLHVHQIPFLNLAETNIHLISENIKYSIVEKANEKHLFIKELKSFFPLKLDPSYQIKQYKLFNDNVLIVCNKGLLVMNIPQQKFVKSKIEAGILNINNKLFDTTIPYKALKNSTLKIKFYAQNLGDENEILIGKSMDKLTYEWEKFSVKELEVNNNENPVFYRLKNIRGEQSEIIELNLDIKSDFNLNFINLILALILVLVYTFAIVWFITKKKNKEIRLLEDELISKTKELQSIQKEKTI